MRPLHAAVLTFLGALALGGLWIEAARRRPVPAEPAPVRTVLIDVNQATLDDLLSLPEIGRTVAERILEHRRAHGPFRTVGDLIHVKGIGPKTLDRLKRRLKAGPDPDD